MSKRRDKIDNKLFDMEATASLDELVKAGLMEVVGTDADGKKQYSITQKGEERVERMMKTAEGQDFQRRLDEASKKGKLPW